MAEEIELLVNDLLSVESLVHSQRLQLFRGLVTYLSSCLSFNMLEKEILCLSVHAFAQAVVDLEEDDDDDCVTMHLETSPNTTIRLSHRVPKWLVKGMKVYYFDVRPHFIGPEGVFSLQCC